MSLLTLLMPIAIGLVLLALVGAPTDVEFSAASALLAALACGWVAIVFFRRWLSTRDLDLVTESDELLRWMLLTMTIVAVDIGIIMVWRFGAFTAMATGSQWFQENRIVGAVLTLNLAAAMVAKLRYPLDRSLGSAWPAVIASIAAVIFFAVVGAL